MATYLEMGEILRRLRIEKELTQLEVAKAIGSSQSEVSAFEKGKHSPSLKRLKAYSDLFGVSIDELVGRQYNEIVGSYDDKKQRVRKKADQ